MFLYKSKSVIIAGSWLHLCVVVLGSSLLCGVLNAQDRPTIVPSGQPLGPAKLGILAQTPLTQYSEIKTIHADQRYMTAAANMSGATSDSTTTRGGPRRITLEEAQQQPAAAGDPMVHLAQLQVEAARQHRLGAESDYLPKISSTLTNFHFNKFMGSEVTIQRPVAGGTVTAGLPLAGKDQTLVAVTAAQPITPLFKLHEVVNIARADERVAMAKAGMPVETSSNVEKAYYGLLVAQRQLAVAKANTDGARNKRLLASNSPTAGGLPSREEEDAEASKALVIASSRVKELTASLDLLLGYAVDTELELVVPATQMEKYR